jgi:hypothetical protein
MEPLFGAARTAARVFVVGSFLGGTGAGITHQLIKLVREAVGPAKPIYGMFLLRWFDLPPTTGQTVDTATLLASMGHGLEYFYRYTKHLLDASMLVGVPDNPAPQVKAVAAAQENDETLSIYPLLAAYGHAAAARQDRHAGRGAAPHVRPLPRRARPHLAAAPRVGAARRIANSQDAQPRRAPREAAVLQEVYQLVSQKDSDFTSSTTRRGGSTWGSVIGQRGEAQQREAASAFARGCSRASKRASNQLRFVTWWFTTVFGDVDLSLFGDTRTRQLYAIKRQRKWTAPEAFRTASSTRFAHEPRVGTERSKTRTPDPDVEMAEKIEPLPAGRAPRLR